MKKLINRAEAVVSEMLEGLLALDAGLRLLGGHHVVLRADWELERPPHVALISGGGSGHEPAHAGYVGSGMLTAAVAGEVFTSPSVDSIVAAIRAVGGPPGVLLIVKNYTGDRLNFGMAAEIARGDGIPVELVIVADDVALAQTAEHAGRRGIAGTVLVHKIAGAAAQQGKSLAEVADVARAAAADVRTMGVALAPCTVPVAGRPGFALAEDEIELGLGIHGEPGVERTRLQHADRLVERMLDQILADAKLAKGERIAVLVNNLGATPIMELAIVARRAVNLLRERGLAVDRAYAGTFLSALEMAGVSISVLPVDSDRVKALDAPTTALAWPNLLASHRPSPLAEPQPILNLAPGVRAKPGTESPLVAQIAAAMDAITTAVQAQADQLNQLDQAVGDGDIGTSLSRGLDAAQAELKRIREGSSPDAAADDPASVLRALGMTLQRAMGGTSGPLYGILLARAAARLQGDRASSPLAWAEAFEAGCQAISALGGAVPGDRTLLDALVPAVLALRNGLREGNSVGEALAEAARAGREGAAATAEMLPRKGRSSYLGQRALGHPDPGARAVSVWLGALAQWVFEAGHAT